MQKILALKRHTLRNVNTAVERSYLSKLKHDYTKKNIKNNKNHLIKFNVNYPNLP